MDVDLLKALLGYVTDGVCLLDLEHRIVYWNRGAEEITGFLALDVTGRNCSDQVGLCACPDGVVVSRATCPLSKTSDDGQPREAILYIRHHQGHRVPVRMRAHAIFDADGHVTGVAEIFTRAGAQGRTELSLAARHSGHDPSTGAVNREYGEMRLAQELAVSQRFGLSTAWMRVDLDRVDALERNFGRGLVDAAMQMIAHTIDANLDPLDCLVRWDARSFRVMLRHAVDARVAELAARLTLLIRGSRINWWGEARDISVTIASVIAAPDDTVESLEARLAPGLQITGGK